MYVCMYVCMYVYKCACTCACACVPTEKQVRREAKNTSHTKHGHPDCGYRCKTAGCACRTRLSNISYSNRKIDQTADSMYHGCFRKRQQPERLALTACHSIWTVLAFTLDCRFTSPRGDAVTNEPRLPQCKGNQQPPSPTMRFSVSTPEV